jgi:hypothetical protein
MSALDKVVEAAKYQEGGQPNTFVHVWVTSKTMIDAAKELAALRDEKEAALHTIAMAFQHLNEAHKTTAAAVYAGVQAANILNDWLEANAAKKEGSDE